MHVDARTLTPLNQVRTFRSGKRLYFHSVAAWRRFIDLLPETERSHAGKSHDNGVLVWVVEGSGEN
jgi:hypothetical protein